MWRIKTKDELLETGWKKGDGYLTHIDTPLVWLDEMDRFLGLDVPDDLVEIVRVIGFAELRRFGQFTGLPDGTNWKVTMPMLTDENDLPEF